jgi:hypothetical protein
MFQSYSANSGWEWFQCTRTALFFPVYGPWLHYSNRQRDNNTLEGEVDDGE